MTFQEYRDLVRSDLHRLRGRAGAVAFLRHLVLGVLRGRPVRLLDAHVPVRVHTPGPPVQPLPREPSGPEALHVQVRERHPAHDHHRQRPVHRALRGIVVNEWAVIGRNCNLSQQVTLGQANRGRRKGYPVVGDGVYIGPGAKLVGAVRIGDNVAIGANCMVTSDVPDDAVVVSVPGRVVSLHGAADYVENTDYDRVPWSSELAEDPPSTSA